VLKLISFAWPSRKASRKDWRSTQAFDSLTELDEDSQQSAGYKICHQLTPLVETAERPKRVVPTVQTC